MGKSSQGSNMTVNDQVVKTDKTDKTDKVVKTVSNETNDKTRSDDPVQKQPNRECTHDWVVMSHPTIPYSGLFCVHCNMER